MYDVPDQMEKKWFCLMVANRSLQKFTICRCIPGMIDLSKETIFNNDHSMIRELMLDKNKIKYVPPVFEVAEVEKDYLICRLDFIESVLRRGAKGIKLTELQAE